jgi:hypothetical protein
MLPSGPAPVIVFAPITGAHSVVIDASQWADTVDLNLPVRLAAGKRGAGVGLKGVPTPSQRASKATNIDGGIEPVGCFDALTLGTPAFCWEGAMNVRSQMLSPAAPHLSARGWKDILFKAGYLTSIAVATVGWAAGLGWLPMSGARSLFF